MMKTSVNLRGFLVVAVFSFAGFSACTTPGGVYTDSNEVKILGDRWNNTDANKSAEVMIKTMTEAAWLDDFVKTHKGEKPVVIVDDIENRTDEHIDTKALTEAIRSTLINSRKVRFVNNDRRQKILDEVKYQQANAGKAKKTGKQLGADYILSGAISNTVEVQGDYKDVTYQVNLNLTNLESAEMEWTTNHKIKKSFKR